MGARRKKTPTGRRTRLFEPHVRKGLIDATRAGVPVKTAAESVGISDRTLRDWMLRGYDEQQRLDDQLADGVEDPQPDPLNRMYWELYRDVMQARSAAAVRNIANVQKASNGGFITEETTRKYRDESGNMVEETTIKRAAPDWRAASWYLERQHRAEFGRDAVQVELTGLPTGDPQEGLPSAKQSEDLAARIVANIAELTPKQITAGGEDILDVEEVEP